LIRLVVVVQLLEASMKKDKMQAKVRKVMKEYKEGSLHSGKGGPVVKSQKQAVAIAMSEAGMAKKK
jgi:ribosomal protein L21E